MHIYLFQNPYVILPFMGFFANVILAIYILSKNSSNLENRLYGLFASTLAIWSAADYFQFSSDSGQDALFWARISTICAGLAAFFLLLFFLEFVKNKLARKKIAVAVLLLPVLFFSIMDWQFNAVTESVRLSWWGYESAGGVLFGAYVIYILLCTIAGLFLGYRFYKRSKNFNEKKQAKLMILAISILLVGGTFTEIIPQLFNFSMIPLTSSLTTCTVIIIAYAIGKYKLMSISSAIAAETIINAMSDSLFVLGAEQAIMLVNPATLKLLGYEKDELYGKSVNFIFATRDFFKKNILAELLEKGELYNFQAFYLSKARKQIPVSLNLKIIKNKAKQLIGIVGIARDITEQKKSEEELKKKNEDLELFNKIAVGRELKMIDLKKKIAELEKSIKKDNL
ncbi:MAG: histidine kinase N-terminal 7TM domain-containing protein [Patescibacteria group bacterium]